MRSPRRPAGRCLPRTESANGANRPRPGCFSFARRRRPSRPDVVSMRAFSLAGFGRGIERSLLTFN